MTIDKIIPCVCCEHPPSTITGPFDYGMPILIPHNNGDHKQWWNVKCPKCGRGGLFNEKSSYYALKAWNECMKRCYQMENKEIVYEEEWKDTCKRLNYDYDERLD